MIANACLVQVETSNTVVLHVWRIYKKPDKKVPLLGQIIQFWSKQEAVERSFGNCHHGELFFLAHIYSSCKLQFHCGVIQHFLISVFADFILIHKRKKFVACHKPVVILMCISNFKTVSILRMHMSTRRFLEPSSSAPISAANVDFPRNRTNEHSAR